MIDPVTRHDLLGDGVSVRAIAAAVHRGDLVRARRGQYLPRHAPADLIAAVRVGGRLACLSELRARGIWVADDGRLHVHLQPNAARRRDPTDRRRPLTASAGVRSHWRRLRDPAHASPGHVSVTDAILQASRCVPRRHLQAILDSAARSGQLRHRALEGDSVVGPLLRLVDTSAGSGLETIVRELARDLGFSFATQVAVDAVGFVDLVIEEWIAVESDGLEFHTGGAVSRDRRRDAELAAAGFTVLRFGYAQIVGDLPAVAGAMIAAVASHRRVRNLGRKARRAVERARAARIS